MKKIELLRELEKYAVFGNKKVEGITRKPRTYTKLMIYRLKREGLIKEVERDKYTVYEDPFIIASNLTWPSYISCWAALRHHNLTEQLPTTIHMVTTRSRKRREITFGQARIIFVRTKPHRFFGFKKIRFDRVDVFIAEPEKALIDSVLFRRVSFSEITDMVRKNLGSIDVEKLVDYLVRTGDSACAKRFGYLLEQMGVRVHGRLGKFVGRSYTVLDYARPAEGKGDERWMVIDNVGIRRAR
jgi:predicted transcriptional regulator of viral defense system